MSFSRHTSRTYLDDKGIKQAINLLSDRISAEPESPCTPYYVGAHLVLNIINNHKEIWDYRVLIDLFDVQLFENGISVDLERNL